MICQVHNCTEENRLCATADTKARQEAAAIQMCLEGVWNFSYSNEAFPCIFKVVTLL